MKKLLIAFVVCQALLRMALAQTTIGIPAIKNYTPTDYNASTQIWDANQDKNGILYFGNQDGLLTFDGSYWKTYPLPNKGAVRALAIDPAGRIFVGGQDEIGYFFPDDNGILKFHTIKNLLPQVARQFADILTIIVGKNEVFFRTVECIFQYDYKSMKTYDTYGGWRMMSLAGGRLFADDREMGLMWFNNGRWQQLNKQLSAKNINIAGIIGYHGDTLMAASVKNGIFLIAGDEVIKKPTAIDAVLSRERVNCLRSLGNDSYAIGTTAQGLFIINGQGKLTEHFTSGEGLQNNNIRSVLLDRDRNLWLGLENGLDLVNYNTPVKHIYPDKTNPLKSNAIHIFNQRLYIGTSNGLYSVPLDMRQSNISNNTGAFTEVPGTKGLVWSLDEINGHLLMGHQDGPFVINNNSATSISTGQGACQIKLIPNTGDLIVGTYVGLQLLKYAEGNFTNQGMVNGIYESLTNIALDRDNVIWASHPYRGIFRLQVSADRKRIIRNTTYTEKNGLPSILNNRVYFIKDKLVAATQKGVYEYDKDNNRFVTSAFYQHVFDNASVEYLTEDAQHNIWFISNQRVGVIDFHKPSGKNNYTVTYFSELAGQTVKGWEYIYPYNAENVLIGSNNGIFHLNYRQYASTGTKFNVLLTTVKAIAEKDSLIFGGYFGPGKQAIPELSNHWDSFHFEYSTTLYAQKSNQEFSHKLIGFDKDWSVWSAKTEKDYTNLPYGRYTFSVKARNNLGAASQAVNYTFIVQPAWYQTVWAWMFYLLLLIFGVYAVIQYLRRRIDHHRAIHEKEQQRQSYLHSLELDRNDKEIMTLKNDKLETELNYKNKELATITMHLVDRGRTMLNIREELTSLIKKQNMPSLAHEFRSVFKLLSDIDKKDDDWNNFAIYFDQVHNNFLSVMKAKYPSLSPTDLKLCAYLRLNLTSKEIAQLLNISLKGVEISRYRVRKKLQLSTEVNLYNFLLEVTN
ncbi:transcriptional regulator [Mucilaginibacter mali]|uniref:Transcriptional regulator n=1 Tax=Mucilaginibacter mali TaxID=2740462 RepID=A0A7D4Q8Y3_9SPHI|nr:two-component regulator propeller domain-containing protein [Mucilaginibacter mali]QKJ29905.1 transcriptional regulator [Mucilaginibacter mali]